MKTYAKPYPEEQSLRKYYYYNKLWTDYKNTIRYNILADVINKDVLEKRKMRDKLVKRKDINNIKLPNIFLNKSVYVNKFNVKRPNGELKY
jgi:hypothetical protein